jgi:hypothetical protein
MGIRGDDPFLQRNLAQAGVLGNQQTQQIAPRITEQFLKNVLPLSFAQSSPAISGLSNAGQISAQMAGANQAAGAASDQATMQAISQIAMVVAMAAMT